MVDVAVAWQRQYTACWFVAPRPRARFVNGAGRPTMVELLEAAEPEARPQIVAPSVGAEFEFGTLEYRAAIYERAVLKAVPAGIPLVVSDDAAVWLAGSRLAARNPLVGVLHADEDAYYELAERYHDRAAALVGVSQRISARAQALVSKGSQLVVTVPCGVPLPPFVEPELATATERLRLVWMGRIEEFQKRVSDLPKIAAHLRAAGVEFQLDVLGDGPERTWLEGAIMASDLKGQVHLHGWRATRDVLRFLTAADILLLPSNFEGLPIIVMEALGAGCAVVASRVSGIEDYEQHPLAKRCFSVYPVGDVAAAAALVQEVGRVSRPERARRARALAEAEFAIERCVARYHALLARLPAAQTQHKLGSGWRAAKLVSHPIAAARVAKLWVRGRQRSGAS
jgi:glycosyltransferase involved in cell wall biosynthesis